MTRPPLWSILAAVALTACATHAGASGPDDPNGPNGQGGESSSVEYVVPKTSRRTRDPLAPPAPSRAPATVVRTAKNAPKRVTSNTTGGDANDAPTTEIVRRSSGSVIRYEPLAGHDARTASAVAIDDAAPTTARIVPPIEDDLVGHDDHAASDDHAGVPEDELPLEDRAGHVPHVTPTSPDAGAVVGSSKFAPRFIAEDLAFPYPVDHVFRGFGPCVGKRHVHEAIDLGGVGPEWGIGTPIRAMTKAEIVFIGRGDENPDDFGVPDKRAGEAARGDKLLPRMKEIAPYGKVYFFTRRQGRWRSGNIIVTRVVGGPLAGHTVRYLHVAAVHPSLKVGDVVAPGQEIALMGGTGVQQSAPHLHLDIEAPDGHRLDVTPILGLPPTASCKVAPTAEVADEAPDKTDESPAERDAAAARDHERAHDAQAKREADPDHEVEAEADHGGDREVAPTARAKASAQKAVAKTAKVAAAPAPAPVPVKPSPMAPAKPDTSETVWTQTIEVPTCGTWSREESFTSGKFDGHALVLDLAAGQKLLMGLERRHGAWAPRVSAQVPRGSKFAAFKPGPNGERAVLEMKSAGRVVLQIRNQGDDAPPNNASYALKLVDECPTPEEPTTAKSTPKTTLKPAKSTPKAPTKPTARSVAKAKHGARH